MVIHGEWMVYFLMVVVNYICLFMIPYRFLVKSGELMVHGDKRWFVMVDECLIILVGDHYGGS